MKDCYGKSYSFRHECSNCALAYWCKDARDIPLSGHVSYEAAMEFIPDTKAQEFDDDSIEKANHNEGFTYKEVCWLLEEALTLKDNVIKSIILMKFANPSITLREIGKSLGVSRQAVSDRLKCFYTKNPVWKSFFRTRIKFI